MQAIEAVAEYHALREALGEAACVPAACLLDIETVRKPGSAQALQWLAEALRVDQA